MSSTGQALAGAQRHRAEPAIDGGGALAAPHDALAVLLEVDAGEVLGDGLVRGGLAGEDEVAAGVADGAGERLAGVEVVAEIDRAEAGEGGPMRGEPALGGGALAILLLRPVLRRDELRRPGQDLGVARRHQAGAEEGVEVLDAAIRAAAARALRAADLARAEVLAAVERDQQPPVQAVEGRQPAGGRHRLHRLVPA